jgi:Fic family protein
MDSRIKHDSTDNSPISAEKTVESIGEKLSTKRKKNFIKIVDYLNEHQTIKAEEIIKLLDKAPSTIREYLQMLVKWGLLKSKGKTKDRSYIRNY